MDMNVHWNRWFFKPVYQYTIDRKSTRLNSSHGYISYAVFCLKKKIYSRKRSRKLRKLKANQTGKKFRVGLKRHLITNRNNLLNSVYLSIHLNSITKLTLHSIN